jgi:hypothetical protein
MYPIIRSASLLIRWWICYLTIENVPIFENETVGWMVGEIISIYTIMWAISYFIVGRFYERGDSPIFGALAYFFVYLVVALVVWLLMLFFTWIDVLPITTG